MSVQTDITGQDWAAFARFVGRSAWKRSMLWYWVIVIGIAVASGAAIRMTGIELHPPSFFAGILVGVILLMSISRLLARRMGPAEDGHVLGWHKLEVSDAGLHVVTKHHEALFAWHGIRGAEVSDKHIFVMVDRNAGIIVPDRSFSSESEREQFIKAVRGRLGGGSL